MNLRFSINLRKTPGELVRHFLMNDLEYQILMLNEVKGVSKYTTLWGIKRLVKRALGVLPGFKRLEVIAYFKYHKFRPRHWWLMVANRYLHHVCFISFQPGFGDMLEVYPYLRLAKQRYPNGKVVVVIHDSAKCRYREMSRCKSSVMILSGGDTVDYIREFLETNPNVDEIIYDDCWGDGYIYGYPTILSEEFGFAFDKKHFAQDSQYLFNASDRDIGNAFLKQNGLLNCVLVAVHFKTAVAQLEELVRLICEDSDNDKVRIKFLVFGSVPSSVESVVRTAGFQIVNLSSSYSKGITTRQLIFIASHASIFLGGRGGFNAIYYLLDIPTINIFDLQGCQEIQAGLWPRNLWEENAVGRIYWEEDDARQIYDESIKRFL